MGQDVKATDDEQGKGGDKEAVRGGRAVPRTSRGLLEVGGSVRPFGGDTQGRHL